jgi:predicted ATPase
MSFEVEGALGKTAFRGALQIAFDMAGNRVLFVREDTPSFPGAKPTTEPSTQVRSGQWREFVEGWQFLNLIPSSMLYPQLQRLSQDRVRLARDGANLAQFLHNILDREPSVLEGIAETLRSVLPYAEDVRPAITRELERSVYLRLTELGIESPLVNWLLSQGTLRIVALLALLRHPEPPSVVFIEELENGLDPRSIHLIVEEIRSFLQAGGQVVATTHSPYLLDLLDISQIVVVERTPKGAPTFRRPSKRRMKGWTETFAPGRLYTMGNLTGR